MCYNVCVLAFQCACEQMCTGKLDLSALVRVRFFLNFFIEFESPGRNKVETLLLSDGESCPNTAGFICTVLMYIKNIYFLLPANLLFR